MKMATNRKHTYKLMSGMASTTWSSLSAAPVMTKKGRNM